MQRRDARQAQNQLWKRITGLRTSTESEASKQEKNTLHDGSASNIIQKKTQSHSSASVQETCPQAHCNRKTAKKETKNKDCCAMITQSWVLAERKKRMLQRTEKKMQSQSKSKQSVPSEQISKMSLEKAAAWAARIEGKAAFLRAKNDSQFHTTWRTC